MNRRSVYVVTFLAVALALRTGVTPAAGLDLGPEELVRAGGVTIQVPGYSVPSFDDWNNDQLNDLIVGQGGGFGDAKVRVYLNVGTEADPRFDTFFYAQSAGADLVCPASGCMGCFPRLIQWDGDGRKDLLVGQANGIVKIFRNLGTEAEPTFDAGQSIVVGTVSDTELDVGNRATPSLVDWNSDGRLDLVVGALDGLIHVYENCGCGGAVPPRFFYSPAAGQAAWQDGLELVVPGLRSSPVVMDLDGDGKKDLLTGNTDGLLLFYPNVGSDSLPIFSGYTLVTSDGLPIDLPGAPRSRPFVCHWTGEGHAGPQDGYWDVLVGSGDGKIRLYRGIPAAGDLNADGRIDFADFAFLARAWRQPLSQAGGPDLNGDGFVDVLDVEHFAALWLTVPQ